MGFLPSGASPRCTSASGPVLDAWIALRFGPLDGVRASAPENYNSRLGCVGYKPPCAAAEDAAAQMTTLIQLVLARARSQQGQETTAREHLARAAKLLDLYLSDADRFPTEGDCD